jgi:hypothetical protein
MGAVTAAFAMITSKTGIAPPLPLRDKKRIRESRFHGFRPGAPGLHPWLQPAAPSGPRHAPLGHAEPIRVRLRRPRGSWPMRERARSVGYSFRTSEQVGALHSHPARSKLATARLHDDLLLVNNLLRWRLRSGVLGPSGSQRVTAVSTELRAVGQAVTALLAKEHSCAPRGDNIRRAAPCRYFIAEPGRESSPRRIPFLLPSRTPHG